MLKLSCKRFTCGFFPRTKHYQSLHVYVLLGAGIFHSPKARFSELLLMRNKLPPGTEADWLCFLESDFYLFALCSVFSDNRNVL